MKALTAVLPLLLAARAFAGDASTDGATADEAAPPCQRAQAHPCPSGVNRSIDPVGVGVGVVIDVDVDGDLDLNGVAAVDPRGQR